MSIFKHRFTVKKPEKREPEEKIKVEHGEPTGVDGAQAGKSVLDWEKGTIFRR